MMQRRTVLIGFAAATASVALAQSSKVNAAAMSTDSAHDEKEFRMGVIGPAELSLATSQIAVERATNANAKEFAGFELTEAIAVTTVLKELGTPVPTMDAKSQATFDKIKSTPKGQDFDKVYIKAQLENHEFLRDLAQNYLASAMSAKTDAEKEGRHLATLSLAVFKEHVAITTRISGELTA